MCDRIGHSCAANWPNAAIVALPEMGGKDWYWYLVSLSICVCLYGRVLWLLLPINRAIEGRIVWQCSAGRHGATIVPKIIINVEHIGQQRLRGASKEFYLFSILWQRDH